MFHSPCSWYSCWQMYGAICTEAERRNNSQLKPEQEALGSSYYIYVKCTRTVHAPIWITSRREVCFVYYVQGTNSNSLYNWISHCMVSSSILNEVRYHCTISNVGTGCFSMSLCVLTAWHISSTQLLLHYYHNLQTLWIWSPDFLRHFASLLHLFDHLPYLCHDLWH